MCAIFVFPYSWLHILISLKTSEAPPEPETYSTKTVYCMMSQWNSKKVPTMRIAFHETESGSIEKIDGQTLRHEWFSWFWISSTLSISTRLSIAF